VEKKKEKIKSGGEFGKGEQVRARDGELIGGKLDCLLELGTKSAGSEKFWPKCSDSTGGGRQKN